MADNGKKSDAANDWLAALQELEEFDRRRETRKSITPTPVAKKDTQPPAHEQVIIRRPMGQEDEDDSGAYEIKLDPATGSISSTPPPAKKAPEPDVAAMDKEGAVRVTNAGSKNDPPSANTPTPRNGASSSKAMDRYEELCKQKTISVKADDLAVMDEFSDVICTVNTASELLKNFRDRYGDSIPEAKLNVWKSNLRDASMIMLKEFYSLRNGKQAKTYDKRNICCKCHTVFMEALPPDRICDECRGSMTPRGAKE